MKNMDIRFEHVALSVSDLERSIDFYCMNFGFELMRTMQGSELLGKIVGMPGCQVRIAHLKCGSSSLELFEYKVPEGKLIPADRIQADKGFNHIGFRSDNVRQEYEKLKMQGVRFISEPVEFRKDVWIVYFHGPDGEVCELREAEQRMIDKW